MLATSLFSAAHAAAQNAVEQSASADAREDARAARSAAETTRWDIERLLMITEALWTLMKKEHGYTDAELIRLVAEIDARDGRMDGRVAPEPPAPCRHCGRIPAKKRPTCLYCGSPIIASPFTR